MIDLKVSKIDDDGEVLIDCSSGILYVNKEEALKLITELSEVFNLNYTGFDESIKTKKDMTE